MAKIINFKRKAVLLQHHKKQEEIISKIIKANLEIEKKLLDWQKQSKKEIGVDIAPRLELVNVAEPPERQAGIKVEDVGQLLDKLKNDAKVI